MSQASVQSIESIQLVERSLKEFAARVDHALVEMEQEIRRFIDWLEHDRPRYWKQQLHRANEAVAEAQSALNRCLMFPIGDERPSCREERMFLRKAQERVAYCQAKSQRVQHWIREVNRELFEYRGQMSRARRILDVDVPRGVSIVARLQVRLEEYMAAAAPEAAALYEAEPLAAELFAEASEQDTQDEAGSTHEKEAGPPTDQPDSGSAGEEVERAAD